jgi:hypothetical protein
MRSNRSFGTEVQALTGYMLDRDQGKRQGKSSSKFFRSHELLKILHITRGREYATLSFRQIK